jgi:hypothetical protein
MNRTEARASVNILHAMARADGPSPLSQGWPIRVVAERLGVSGSKPPPETDLDAELRKVKSPEVRRLTLRAAFAIATGSGHSTPAQRLVLEKLYLALGDGTDRVAVEAAWRGRAAAAADALERATDGFLRQITIASDQRDLSIARYERLVAELELSKREIVGRVLASIPAPR